MFAIDGKRALDEREVVSASGRPQLLPGLFVRALDDLGAHSPRGLEPAEHRLMIEC